MSPSSSARRRRRPRPRAPWTVCLALAGCLSPAEASREADRDVVALVDARRERLFGDREAFALAPPADGLAARVERGEWAGAATPLDLPASLAIAAEYSRDLAERKERLYLAALDVTLERWRLGWQPGLDGDAAVAGSGGEGETIAGGGRGALTRLLGSGARVVLDIGANFLKLVGNGDGFDVFTDFGVSITQPLLAGAGKRIVREPLTQAERSLVYEVRAYERFRRTFAVDVTSRLLRVVQQSNAVANQRLNVESLTVLRERNQALARAGRLSDIQSDQARQDELRSESRLLGEIQQFADQLDAFKLFLGLPLDVPITVDDRELELLAERRGDILGDLEEELSDERVVEIALARRLDRLTALDRVDDAERRVYIAANALQARLGLAADARALTPANKPLSPRIDDVAWSAGLDLELPVNRLAERNALREREIELVQARRGEIQLNDTIHADLLALLREARTRRRTWDLQTSAVEVAERRVESARLYLEAGRADTRDLLEAQEALLEARNAATAALIDYALAKIALLRDMELLELDVSGLHLADDWQERVQGRATGAES